MAERWKTQKFALEGGLIENEDLLAQAEAKPGSLVQAINYEPGLKGGYRSVNGYIKFDDNIVPGTPHLVTGVFVYDDTIIAIRGTTLYTSVGAGWTSRGSLGPFNPGAFPKWRATKYNFASPTIMIICEKNGRPSRWDGTTLTEVTDAPENASCIAEHRQHIFLGVGSSLFFSQPTDDVSWDATLGAGEINVGEEIVNIIPFRENLYVFCRNSIGKLTGDSFLNFQYMPVTSNIGCAAADSIQEIGGNLIFLGPDGLRPIAATERNNDVEISSISRAIQKKVTSILEDSSTQSICSCIVREKSQYRLFGTNEDDDDTAFGVLGGLRRLSDNSTDYEWFEMRGFQPYCIDSAYINSEEYVVFGGYDGYVYRMEKSGGRDGGDLTSVLQTPYITFGDPTIRKTLYKTDIYVDFEENQVGSIDLNVLYDYSESEAMQPPTITIEGGDVDFYWNDGHYWGNAMVWADVAATVAKKNLIGSGFTASFKFTRTDNNPPHAIRSFVVQYNVGGRR